MIDVYFRRPVDLGHWVVADAGRIKASWSAGAYELTARVDTNDLEVAWRKTNNTDKSWSLDENPGVEVVAELPVYRGKKYGHRSAMTGDVFIRGDEAFFVAMIGFEPVSIVFAKGAVK